jgi:hypothetical protein
MLAGLLGKAREAFPTRQLEAEQAETGADVDGENYGKPPG